MRATVRDHKLVRPWACIDSYGQVRTTFGYRKHAEVMAATHGWRVAKIREVNPVEERLLRAARQLGFDDALFQIYSARAENEAQATRIRESEWLEQVRKQHAISLRKRRTR